MNIDKETLVNLLDQSYTNEQLAAYFGKGITTIKRAKTKYGLVGYKTNSKPLSNKQVKNITALADSGKSLQQICRDLGISDYLLKKYIDKPTYLRILSNSKEVWVSNLIKADITPIFTPNAYSAYICGILQSDGYLTSDNYIGLTVRDKDFAKQFADFFKTTVKTIDRDGTIYYSCRFKDVRNVEKFKQVTNILPNKTYLGYTIPTWIKQNEEFMLNFIVGVFNGDGWVYKPPSRNTCEIGIEQHSASTDFLTDLNNWLDWSVYTQEGSFRIHTKSINKVQQFYDWYAFSEYALLRKVEVLDSVFL